MRRFGVLGLNLAALVTELAAPCHAAESFWFTGPYGALGSVHVIGGSPVSFYLIGGKYSLYVHAARPFGAATAASRSCFFNGNLQRISPTHDVLRIGTVVPISTIVPYKLGPTNIDLQPGLYALYVTSASDCDWKILIGSTSDNGAGVAPVMTLKRVAGRVMATDTAAVGETLKFDAQYRNANDRQAPAAGTLELVHDGIVFRSEPLRTIKNVADGGDQFMADVALIPDYAKYLGKNIVKFRVTIGAEEFISTGEFTLTK